MGGGPLAAIKMGEKDNDGAEIIMGNAVAALVLLAVIITCIFQIYKEPILWMFGASNNTAGVGLSFPIITLISAFAALIGMGGGPLAAIKMGEKDNDGAEKIMGNAVAALVLLAVIITCIFQIYKEPILCMFGASNNTISYAVDYIQIYLAGTIFVMIALGLNPFITTQGFAKTGMITVASRNYICYDSSWIKPIYNNSGICKNRYDNCCNRSFS